MCSCCTATTKKYWVFGCGSGILLLALIVGLLWPTLSLQVLYSVRIFRSLIATDSKILTLHLHVAISVKEWFAFLPKLD